MTRNLDTHTAQLLSPIISKLCYTTYMVITRQNIKILLSLLWLSHPTISKFYQSHIWSFFGLVILHNLFLEIGRSYASIIITIISNITVSVSHNVISFGCFMPINHGVNKKAPPVMSPPPPLPYQLCTRFVCCFTSNTNTLINPFLL